jgi:hypothetical protein
MSSMNCYIRSLWFRLACPPNILSGIAMRCLVHFRSRKCTTSDHLGRTLLEERPGFGNTILSTANVYDPGTGRLLSTTQSSSAGGVYAASLYQYDSLGSRYRTTQDLDLDGLVNLAGPDRVSDTLSDYVQLAGDWHRETRQYIYPADATAKQVSTQRQRLTGLGTAVPGGILVAESQSLDLLGNPTVSRTLLDRATRRVVNSTHTPASTLDALTVSVNGLVLTNVTATGVTTIHAYDPLARRILSRTGDRLVALSGYDTPAASPGPPTPPTPPTASPTTPSPAAASPSPTPLAKPPTPPTMPKAA